jgi:hypothetical protein
VAFSFMKLFIAIIFKVMGKTVYLTQEQVDKLRKNLDEEAQGLEMPVQIEPGDNIIDKVAAAKDNVRKAGGEELANKTEYTITGSQLNCKKYTKKQVVESRLNTIRRNNPSYTKSDFIKTILKNG